MQSMILRQSMATPPSLFALVAIVMSVLSCLQTVNAGFAFLANQADCKLTCLNGGVCAFDTQQTNIHKCICFIGLFEGEQCQIQVTNEPSPSPNHLKDEDDDEEEMDEMDEESEEHHIQATEDQQPEQVEEQQQEPSQPEQKHQEHTQPEEKLEEEPYHQEVHEFAEANADEYETELSAVEPEEETMHNKQEVELVTAEPIQPTQSMDNGGSDEKYIEEVTPKQVLPNIHLGDSSNFVDLPNNPRGIKHYENTRTRAPIRRTILWPQPGNTGPGRGQAAGGTQDNSTPPPAHKPQERQQRRKKKPVKKQQEEEELEESMPGGGWMMSKRGKQTGSSTSGTSPTTTYFPCLLWPLMLLLTNLRFHLL